ncbi:MAG: maleylpyruvate isomerase family mycothiol-dependent enzyme [Microthrixaceae bacterium]|nr:maleylpyruvate isomerase family mycothiol-dependent enzyme [Microthrixaceae bacterium]
MTAPDVPGGGTDGHGSGAPESSDAYSRAVERTSRLLARIDERTAVPATPGWLARDVLAHLVGVADDVLAGNVQQYAQDQWTEAQVAARRDRSVDDLLSDWESLVEPLVAVLRDPVARGLDASFASLPVIDLLAHEHDLREAVGEVGFADATVWTAVESRRREVLALQHAMALLPPLEVRTDDGDRWTFGEGPGGATVTAPRYELWRSLEGRRTRSAVADFDWTVDPGAYLDHWVAFVFEWVPEPAP